MKIQIKICGIRNAEMAHVAAEAGADFLGFNFIPLAKRYIHPEEAKKIIDSFKRKKIQYVGIFSDNDITYVNSIVHSVGLDYVQLHGNETQGYCRRIHSQIIKHIQSPQELRDTFGFALIDREEQIVHVHECSKRRSSLMLAGGLNPQNVIRYINTYHPDAVDVARGVETDGIQDPEKIIEFVASVRKGNI